MRAIIFLGLILLASSAQAFNQQEFSDIVHNCMPATVDFFQDLQTNYSTIGFGLDGQVEFFHNLVNALNELQTVCHAEYFFINFNQTSFKTCLGSIQSIFTKGLEIIGGIKNHEDTMHILSLVGLIIPSIQDFQTSCKASFESFTASTDKLSQDQKISQIISKVFKKL